MSKLAANAATPADFRAAKFVDVLDTVAEQASTGRCVRSLSALIRAGCYLGLPAVVFLALLL